MSLFAEPASGRPRRRGDPRSAPADAADVDRALVCGACGHPVTHARHRISVQGAHEHRFMNPGGFLYHLGCFADAIGCATVGPASHEYAWFAGFAWRLALCGGCGVQLGWWFGDGAGATFFGLVLDRLREADADAG